MSHGRAVTALVARAEVPTAVDVVVEVPLLAGLDQLAAPGTAHTPGRHERLQLSINAKVTVVRENEDPPTVRAKKATTLHRRRQGHSRLRGPAIRKGQWI
jgi:hypothetical protein